MGELVEPIADFLRFIGVNVLLIAIIIITVSLILFLRGLDKKKWKLLSRKEKQDVILGIVIGCILILMYFTID